MWMQSGKQCWLRDALACGVLDMLQTNSPKIFMRYQSWAEYPYSPDFIPVMTHINLHLGAKFFINTKTKKNV